MTKLGSSARWKQLWLQHKVIWLYPRCIKFTLSPLLPWSGGYLAIVLFDGCFVVIILGSSAGWMLYCRSFLWRMLCCRGLVVCHLLWAWQMLCCYSSALADALPLFFYSGGCFAVVVVLFGRCFATVSCLLFIGIFGDTCNFSLQVKLGVMRLRSIDPCGHFWLF